MKNNLEVKQEQAIKTKISTFEYRVCVFVTKVDAVDNKTTEDWTKIFSSTKVLKSRKEAIEYYDQTLKFFNEEDCKFTSKKAAKKKGYKNYNSFSIWLELHHDENIIELDGSSESFFEMLAYESYFLNNDKNVHFITVIDCDGESVEVIKDDYQILESYFNRGL